MTNDNLKDKIKRFFLKLIYCNQKYFIADNIRFNNARPTTVKNSMIAENNDYLLKLELYKHRHKYNSIEEEAKILEYLKKCGAMCQPIIKSVGKNHQNFNFIIMEKIEQKEGTNLADVLLAILEQHKFGVFHRDTKTDNVVFNGLIAKIIDYDQSQFREETKALKPKESIMYFIENLKHFWKFNNKLLDIGQGIDEVTKNCMSNFTGDAFDFSKTNLYKSFKEVPFWEIDENEVVAEGKFNIKYWEDSLNEIGFNQNERIIEINPDTGALSRYLARKNCNVSIYSKNQNEILATKIISNLLGLEIKIAENTKDEFDTLIMINNKEESLEKIYNKAKRIILRVENNSGEIQKVPANYRETRKIELNDGSILLELEKIE